MERFQQFAVDFGNFIWSLPLFLLLLGCGVIFSVLSKFIQYRVLTHGIAVIRGKYDRPDDAGQINHFQALCAALSATIGLGNIAGVALAVQLGGPGAVFWMWVVGFFGMAIKFVECGLATMFRDERDVPDPGAPALMEEDIEAHRLDYPGHRRSTSPARARGEVSGGPMWYVFKGLALPARKRGQGGWYHFFRAFAILFAAVTFVASFGGGNSFQSWNVAELLDKQYNVERWVTGAVLTVLVSLVIIGGIKRIGQVAGKLVPLMCVIYVGGAFYIILGNADAIPSVLSLIVRSAFAPLESEGAFLGTSVGVAFTWGLRRALFSNEAGQGSAAIAHAAAKTDEPVREGIVAGIGPFIDTLIICTMTALVILFAGVHDRAPFGTVRSVEGGVVVIDVADEMPEKMHQVIRADVHTEGATVDVWHVDGHTQGETPARHTLKVIAKGAEDADHWYGAQTIEVDATDLNDEERAEIKPGAKVHLHLEGSNMTRFAFDTGIFGFGKWMVTLGVILFAFSTMISWSYYGEKSAEFLFGPGFVLPFKFMFVTVIFCGCVIDEFSIVYDMGDALAGAMVLVNLPATLLLLPVYLRATRDYFNRLDSGQMPRQK